MKQCKDNCLCWRLANRLVQCYWQTYLSCPTHHPQTTFHCVWVGVYLLYFRQTLRGGQAGALQRSIDLYIGDITPNWVSDLPLPSTNAFFFIPLLFPPAFKRHRNGASGTREYMYNHQCWINTEF